MRVLAVGAHPDDIEIVSSGTLLRFKEQGAEVYICHALNGDKGHYHIPPAELARTRIAEAQEAGKLMGAEVFTLGLSDAELIAEDLKTRGLFIDAIRRAKPDLIITHNPEDYMPDHVATSKLVRDAAFCASLPHFKTEYPSFDSVPPIYYMDTLAGIGFQPEEYVDISGVIELKEKMLACHQSQVLWMQEHDHVDLIGMMKLQCKFRGLQCGVDYAEGFVSARIYPSIKPARLLP
jgi:LmbE family N-acetylglucosaminyl deacetylase